MRKHLLFLLLIQAVPLLLMGGAITAWEVREQTQAFERNLQERARTVSLAIDQDLTTVLATLQAVTGPQTLREGNLRAFYDVARELKESHPAFDSILLVDASGQQLVNLYKPFGAKLPNVGAYDTVRRTIESGQPVFSNVMIGPVAGKPIVVVSLPVFRSGKVAYLLQATIDPVRWRNQMIAWDRLTPRWFLTLVDRDNQIIARSRHHEAYVGGKALDWWSAGASGRNDGVIIGSALDGPQVASAFHRSELSGWVVSLGAPVEELQAPLWRALVLGGGVTGTLIVLSIGGALLAGRRIEHSIGDLVACARAIMARHDPGELPASHITEIEELRVAMLAAGREVAVAERRDRAMIETGEARFRAAQEASLDGFIIYEPVRGADGKLEDLTVLYANPMAAHYARANSLDMIGRRIGDINPGNKAPGSLIDRLGCLTDNSQPLEFVLHYDADGIEGHFQNLVVPFQGCIAATFRDISDSVRQSAELEAARRAAEQANDAKTRFLAAASHDLRQPVQALRLLLHLVTAKASDPALCGIVARMGEALDSTERMLGRLMEFAALEAGRVAIRRQAFRLDALLARIADEAAIEAQNKGLRLKVVAFPCTVDSDPVLLERVIRNLVWNALRYTRRGGILIGLRRRHKHVILQVTDTGLGIPASMQVAIFEEFRQLGNPERDRDKGMGLGLAIVARTADLLSHRLDLRSREGKGSTFAIVIPCTCHPGDAALAPAAATGAAREPQRGRILLIEDDAIQALALTTILKGAGFDTVAATDADEAAGALEDGNKTGSTFDIILSDYRLPQNVSGIDVIHMARERLGRFVPAILITGDTNAAIAEEAARQACAVLHKPYSPAVLIELIGRLLADAGKSEASSG